MIEANLRVTIGDLVFKNPVLTASGTFGYAKEFAPYVNLHHLGGVVVKGISLEPMRSIGVLPVMRRPGPGGS